MYPSLILRHKFFLAAYISHKNSYIWCSLLGTLLIHLACFTPYCHARFVDEIHLHKRQCIVPPEWLGAHLHLCPKILQGHILLLYTLDLCNPNLCCHVSKQCTTAKNYFSWVGRPLWQPLSSMLSYAMAIHLASTLRQCQNHSPPYAPQKVWQVSRTWARAAKTTCS